VSREDALTLRKGESGTLFYRVLEDSLIKLNKGLVFRKNVGEIISAIEAVKNNIEGNAEILSWMRGEKSIFDEKEKRRRNIAIIDFDRPNRNTFQVTDEWQYNNGREKNRADIMFLINGIPVAIVETKSARITDGIEKGLIQIREYHRETPEMLTSPQVFDITHLIDFYYGSTWNLDRKNLFNWKDEAKGNFENKVKRFFDRKRFLKMLKEWILFYIKDDELQKTILRQHQTRAIEKVVERCADSEKKTGLIWHTQGSGKTFTMITAARQVLENKEVFGKATVILMIHRNELEGQLSGWVDRIPSRSTVTWENPIFLNFPTIVSLIFLFEMLSISAGFTSILAIFSCFLTRQTLNPRRIKTSSAWSTISRAFTVIGVPYGILVARHARAGLFQVSRFISFESSRMSSLVSPASIMGARTPISCAAVSPGRKSLRSSVLAP
jgi:hypothetical protein